MRSGFVYGQVRDHCDKISAKAELSKRAEIKQAGCGFGIREGDWKLVYQYGGFADTVAKSVMSPSPKPVFCNKELQLWKPLCPDRYCLFNAVRDPSENHEVRASASFVDAPVLGGSLRSMMSVLMLLCCFGDLT